MPHPDSIATTLLPGVRVSVLIGFQPKAAKSYVSMILIRYACNNHWMLPNIYLWGLVFSWFLAFFHSAWWHGLFIVSTIAHNIQEFSILNWGSITSKNFDEYDIMVCMVTKQQPALTSDDAAVLNINNLHLKYEVRYLCNFTLDCNCRSPPGHRKCFLKLAQCTNLCNRKKDH